MLNGPIAQLVMSPADVWQTTGFSSFSRQSRVEVNVQSDLEEMLQKLDHSSVLAEKDDKEGILRQRRCRRKFLELAVPSGILAMLCLVFCIIFLVNTGHTIALCLQTDRFFEEINELKPVVDSLTDELRVKTRHRFSIATGSSLTEAYKHTDQQINNILKAKTFHEWQLISRLSDFRKYAALEKQGDLIDDVIADTFFYLSYIEEIQEGVYNRVDDVGEVLYWKTMHRYLDTTGRHVTIRLLTTLLNVLQLQPDTTHVNQLSDINELTWIYYASKMASHRRWHFYYSNEFRLTALTQSLELLIWLRNSTQNATLARDGDNMPPATSVLPSVLEGSVSSTDGDNIPPATSVLPSVLEESVSSTDGDNIPPATSVLPSVLEGSVSSTDGDNMPPATSVLPSVLEESVSSTTARIIPTQVSQEGASVNTSLVLVENTTLSTNEMTNLTENNTSMPSENTVNTDYPPTANVTAKDSITTEEQIEEERPNNTTAPLLQVNDTQTETVTFAYTDYIMMLHDNLSVEARVSFNHLVTSNNDLLQESLLLFCGVLLALGLAMMSVVPFGMLLKHQSRLVIGVSEWLDLVSGDLDSQRLSTQEVLRQLIPSRLIRKMSEEQKPSEKLIPFLVNEATFLMVSVDKFDQLFQLFTPSQTLQILTLVMELLDDRMEQYNVLPVAMMGNCHIIISDTLQDWKPQHAYTIANLSLDMISCCSDLEIGSHSVSKLQMKIGVHSGPCIGMVRVKNGSMKFTLTGSSVKVLQKVHKTALPNIIQVSDTTESLLTQCESYSLNKRGTINVKDVGEHTVYCLNGRRVSSATFAPDSCSSQIGSWIELERKPLYKLDEEEGSYEPLHKAKGHRRYSKQSVDGYPPFNSMNEHISPYSSS